MTAFERLLRRVAQALTAIAAACLVFLMLMTFFDVVGRYFFNAPVTFTVELTELAMGLVILLGLGMTTLRQEHITVDVVLSIMPAPLARLATIAARLCALIFLAIIAWQLTEQAMQIMADGLVTQVLGTPVFPAAFVMAAGAAFACLVAVWLFTRPAKHAPKGVTDGSA